MRRRPRDLFDCTQGSGAAVNFSSIRDSLNRHSEPSFVAGIVPFLAISLIVYAPLSRCLATSGTPTQGSGSAFMARALQ